LKENFLAIFKFNRMGAGSLLVVPAKAMDVLIESEFMLPPLDFSKALSTMVFVFVILAMNVFASIQIIYIKTLEPIM